MKKHDSRFYRRTLNWNNIINDMTESIGIEEIAIKINANVSGLRAMMHRKGEPKESTGASLLTLHLEVCGEDLNTKRQEECNIKD